MNRDELAKTLFVQEQLLNVSGDEAKLRERRIDSLIQEKGLAAAQRVLAEKGIKGLEQQASISEQFGQSMEKLKEIFVAISPAIMAIGDALIPVLKLVGAIFKFLEPIMGLIGGAVAGAAVGSAFGGVGAIPGAIIGALGGGTSDLYRRAGDIISPSMGKTQVSTKEGGLFELSQNDDLLAGPGLASTGLASKGIPGGNNSSLIAEIRSLRAALESRPINVNTTVELDGERIGSSKNVIRGLGNNSTELGTELSTNSSNLQ